MNVEYHKWRSWSLGREMELKIYGHGGKAVPEAFPGEAVRWVLQAEQLGTGHAALVAMPGTPDENRILLSALKEAL